MKKRNLLLFMSVAIIILLTSFAAFYPSGAPAGYSGSPGDGSSNCSNCHGTAPTTSAGWITSNIPAAGYTPGQTYQITATNTMGGSGKYGFEISPQNSTGTLLGSLTSGTNSQLVGSGKYITHTSASSTINTWTFSWTAPVVGTGSVTFYGAFARNYKGNTVLSTLVVAEHSITTDIEEISTQTMQVFPSPSTGNFTVALSGMKEKVNLKLLDLTGHEFYSTIVSGNGTTKLEYQLSPGIYLVQVHEGSNRLVKKLFIR